MSAKKNYKRFSRTDAGNAELFAKLYKGTVLFDHRQQRWLIWDKPSCRWIEDTIGQVYELAKTTAQWRYKFAGTLPNSTEQEREDQKREASWALGSQNLYRINAALKSAESVQGIADKGKDWDADPWLFGVANGIVDLRTGKLRQGTQQDRITKFSPVVFDDKATCPRFEQFMDEAFDGDTELIGYVQRAGGYTLTGSTREQCVFACHGKGSNGKTTLLEALFHILGDYGVDLPFSTLETKHYPIGEGVNLPGARFAKSVETKEGRQIDEARIKSWTGGDTISVRPLHRNAFSFSPTHKLWLSFNHRPIITDDSDAMWRRWREIPFNHTFDSAHADKDLLEKLKAEASGILNWLIEGCLAWQKEDGLKTPAAVEQATSEYEHESDPLAPFFDECCELGAAFDVPKGDLLSAYRSWCAANKEKPVSRNAFAEKMRSRDFGEGSTGSVRYWTGLRLHPATAPGGPPDATYTTNPPFQVLPNRESCIETTENGPPLRQPCQGHTDNTALSEHILTQLAHPAEPD